MRPSAKVLANEHLALRGVARIIKMDALLIKGDRPVALEMLEDIIEYIKAFPDKFHHPKEEDYLFKAMRLRSEDTHEILDRIFLEHKKEYQLIEDFDASLQSFKKDPIGQKDNFADIAIQYSDFLNAHLDLENKKAFPMAEKVLTEEDWAEIDAAFSDNNDPIVAGAEKTRFDQLHKRIMDLGLPPFGMHKKY
jgi:hemerythrin-like domain-containing protein